MEKEKEESEEENEAQEQIRIRQPRKGEIMGVIMQRLGGNRMEIKTTDGKTRNCRVPGRFKRKFWLRPGDMVIITPWEFDDTKGDVIYQYSKAAASQLKKRGLVENLEENF